MAALNFADLAKPVSADDPCGPDPDADPDVMNVMARLEVALPTSYFRRDDEGRQIPFDRSTIDFPVAFGDLGKVLKQSRDLRGFVLAGKLCLLNRDIAGFAASLGLIVSYLGEYWEEVYPRAEDGDFIMREVALQGLDENATVALPLQHAPLFLSKRLGPVMFRSQLVASGELRPGEDEQHPDAGGITAALKEAELSDLTAMLGHVSAIRDAQSRLRTIWSERLGADQAVTFPRLAALVGQIIVFLEAAIERKAPGGQGSAVADAPAAGGGVAAAGPIAVVALPAGVCASVDEAQAALAGCLGYFRRVEPSSPAVLLIGQAQRLIGKSLIEVIQIMFPEHVDKAMLEIGDDTKYQLPLERLGGDGSGGYGDDSGDDGYASDGDEESSSYEDEDSSSDDEETDAGDGADEETDDEGEQGADEEAESEQPQAETESRASASAAAASVPAITIASRAEAIARMKAVAGFYRHAEPSNPVPLLMDKACALAQQDFLSLLSDILPDVGIRQSSGE
ncbi:Type VI secretion-associated protein, ImpA family [Bosea sp. 62]|uniref:type VI secretion system protein TssA n=1 Tax=unclassified Bosea (in: a-proteobacteria) TaxID=2653178 RepID=UPI0012563E58|nr:MULTISPECIES: type VI secretion system ImpA family N-terminal domain-containing protein [unclassified Bosea (in: a-proteobacteria)]CAD5257870.1 Type VI secretion-associated protein, ImpA family [Bosea sp. 46]CAD5262306.1 Type VI secretion-associated protein, ImpA family [Bosea sp. 21B]CAD5278175.1 Type VI secretion-associated protein, ImpA family [Bosea sp. 7B]VVT58693.1 Type VI secretion-associated protein, ImpA family [Bosea sp. EC-HK365B]VXB58875.1 Type VI secretion-associated protein, I